MHNKYPRCWHQRLAEGFLTGMGWSDIYWNNARYKKYKKRHKVLWQFRRIWGEERSRKSDLQQKTHKGSTFRPKAFCSMYLHTTRKIAQSCPILWTPWTIQSMEFSRLEYWSEYLFPSPGHLPIPGTELGIAGRLFTSWAAREAQKYRSG